MVDFLEKIEEMHNIDWECIDCGMVYRADEGAGHRIDDDVWAGMDSGPHGLPKFCPECGDHEGWTKGEL